MVKEISVRRMVQGMQCRSCIAFHLVITKHFYLSAFYMCVEKDKEEREMLYCPRCGSPNVEWLLPQIWSKWVCRDCGYIGVLILEDGKIAAELRKEWKKAP